MTLLSCVKRLLRLGLPLIALASSAIATPAADFAAANRLFAAGDFTAASQAYQNLITADGPSAARLYNLGNSQFRSGDVGAAILSYERARLLAPRDPDLMANLAHARKTAAVYDAPSLPPWLDSAVTWISRNEWSWLTAASTLWIGVVCLVAGTRGSPTRSARTLVGASCIPALLIAAISTTALILRREDDRRAIVLTKDAAIRLSPFEKAEPIGTPGVGRTVLLGTSNGGYRHVRVPGTELSGWMFEGEISPIIPRT